MSRASRTQLDNEVTEIIPLGTNGFYPSYGRQTMCFLLLLADGRALLLDAGSGFARLAEPAIQERLADHKRLDVVLSHYHLDHVIGLTYASAAWGRPLKIWCPAPPLVDAQPEEALGRLIGPPLFPLRLDAFPIPIEVESYRNDFTVAGMPVCVRRQHHPGGSVGLRFGDALAYVTDTVADEETVDFAQGAGLLLHEIWASDQEATAQPFLVKGHAAIGPVVEIAERAKAGCLVPVHHHPKRQPAELEIFLDEIATRCAIEVARLIEGVAVRVPH